MRKLFRGLLVFFVALSFASCTAYKSNKCGCPTFGSNRAHAVIAQPAKLSGAI